MSRNRVDSITPHRCNRCDSPKGLDRGLSCIRGIARKLTVCFISLSGNSGYRSRRIAPAAAVDIRTDLPFIDSPSCAVRRRIPRPLNRDCYPSPQWDQYRRVSPPSAQHERREFQRLAHLCGMTEGSDRTAVDDHAPAQREPRQSVLLNATLERLGAPMRQSTASVICLLKACVSSKH